MTGAKPMSQIHRIVVVTAAVLLGGCNMMQRLSEVGDAPAMTEIANPVTQENYRPVTLPMPQPIKVAYAANSLWRPGARAFFRDQRAAVIGDILTVRIDITDEASIENTTTRRRDNSEDADISALLGLEEKLFSKVLGGFSPSVTASLGSQSNSTGAGTVDRSEEIQLTIAAIVTQVLPNGNLVIHGSQEVRVNFEKRVLKISGVIRPEDIDATNSIQHTQIAEARIVYGGAGQLTDVQQARYGQQIFDIVYPF